MKKKGKAVNKRQKGEIQTATGEEQKGGSTSQTAVVQQKVQRNKTKKGRGEKDKALQEKGSNSSGDTFKK